MPAVFHVLNGDSLDQQLPASVEGTRIVFRECLVDGPVKAVNEDDFFARRAEFLFITYHTSPAEYMQGSKLALQKLDHLPAGAEVNLWFEDDLFCQVNCWYVFWRLRTADCRLFVVHPPAQSPYSFGHVPPSDLPDLLAARTPVTHLQELATLWPAYAAGDNTQLVAIAHQLQGAYPHVVPAAEAQRDRMPANNQAGRPMQALQQIIDELGTEEFTLVFREFCKREGIYGFGDLQVKRLYDELLAGRR